MQLNYYCLEFEPPAIYFVLNIHNNWIDSPAKGEQEHFGFVPQQFTLIVEKQSDYMFNVHKSIVPELHVAAAVDVAAMGHHAEHERVGPLEVERPIQFFEQLCHLTVVYVLVVENLEIHLPEQRNQIVPILFGSVAAILFLLEVDYVHEEQYAPVLALHRIRTNFGMAVKLGRLFDGQRHGGKHFGGVRL